MNKVLALIIFASFLAGCVSTEVRSPDGPLFAEVALPVQGKGYIYLYRPVHPHGHGVWPEVYIANKHIVGLKTLGFTYLQADPGDYQITTKKSSFYSGLSNSPGMIRVQPNKNTYVRFTTVSERTVGGFWENKGHFWVMVPEDEALAELKSMHHIKANVTEISP